MRILIVEDQELDQLILKSELQEDFEVMTVTSADEAIAFAVNNYFDLAIINVMIQSDMDCIELLHDLRVIAENEFTAFAITSHITEDRARRLMRAGFREIIQKPFDRDVFDQLVRKAAHRESHLREMNG